MTSPDYLFKKKVKNGRTPTNKDQEMDESQKFILVCSPLVVLVHSWIAIYCRWSCQESNLKWHPQGQIPSTQGHRTLPHHDNSWHTSTYPWDLMHHRLEDASGILEVFGPQHLRFSEWTLAIGCVLPKPWDTSVERVADAHATPTASILSQFWRQQMESAVAANCHGWFAPAHCPCVSLLQTHSVWWRPIKAGRGRGGTRQAFKIASIYVGKKSCSFSIWVQKTMLGSNPFQLPTWNAAICWTNSRASPQFVAQKSVQLVRFKMSIRIIYQCPLVQMSVILIKFHQTPLISCKSH